MRRFFEAFRNWRSGRGWITLSGAGSSSAAASAAAPESGISAECSRAEARARARGLWRPELKGPPDRTCREVVAEYRWLKREKRRQAELARVRAERAGAPRGPIEP